MVSVVSGESRIKRVDIYEMPKWGKLQAEIEILNIRGTGQIDCPFSQDKATWYIFINGNNLLPLYLSLLLPFISLSTGTFLLIL